MATAATSRGLLFAATQVAAKAVQPEVPSFVYTHYAVQSSDQKYLPFAEAPAPAGDSN